VDTPFELDAQRSSGSKIDCSLEHSTMPGQNQNWERSNQPKGATD